MLAIVFALLIAFHGIVHLLYAGHAQGMFALEEGLTWPDGSWLFARFLDVDGVRLAAAIACVLAALLYLGAAASVVFRLPGRRLTVMAAAAFSGALFVAFWDGRGEHLAGQGVVAIMIDAAIVLGVLIPERPVSD